MQLTVTIQISGKDVATGKLFTQIRNGVETSSFTYEPSYLQNQHAFPLAPDMPLTAGTFHAQGMIAAFNDAMPDRWGKNLLQRAEAKVAAQENRTPRTLFESDYLTGVSDTTRQGALRFWADEAPVAPQKTGVPKEVSIPALLGESYLLEEDENADVQDLFDAGSSLGGARPKASVVNEREALCIAKFPKKDESLVEDTCAWEFVALQLAKKAGINVPATKLLRIGGKAVLLSERFDRKQDTRVPYMSGLTAIQGKDGGQYSYLELVDFLEQYGSKPEVDIKELWSRILFSCLIGNTDDHMRNHGFLWDGKGWRLSPAFDINPTPGNGYKFLRNTIDFDDASATVKNALRAAENYRIEPDQAKKRLGQMRGVLKSWTRVASAQGISKTSIGHMSGTFENALQ